MRFVQTFSALVLGALAAGVGLVVLSTPLGSEFLRGLGVFPLLLAMFLLPYALVEWEAARAARSGNRFTGDGARLGLNATTAEAATAVRP